MGPELSRLSKVGVVRIPTLRTEGLQIFRDVSHSRALLRRERLLVHEIVDEMREDVFLEAQEVHSTLPTRICDLATEVPDTQLVCLDCAACQEINDQLHGPCDFVGSICFRHHLPLTPNPKL